MRSDIGQIIARNVKSLRKTRKLSLQKVADRAGITKSYLWEIERGKNTNPSISALMNLSAALGCSLEGLVGSGGYREPALHPEAMRIAVEVDALLRKGGKDA